ncbi:S41 family peptidase [Salinispira pacifica]
MNKRWFILSAASAAVVLAFAGGVLFGRAYDPSAGLPSNQVTDPAPPNFSLIRDAWHDIDRAYVDRSAVKSTPLTYGAISGMVSALGDTGHSTFLTPDMVKQEKTLTSGQYVGVGLNIQMKNGQVTIVAPFQGSPADRAGLTSGEIIRRVNGKDISQYSLGQVVQRIVGDIGTKVTLTIFNPDTGDLRDVTLTRSRIVLHNVTHTMIADTGFADLRIAEFSQGVTKDLKSAIAAVKSAGARGIVLDLRNNPGGVLDEAIGVASQFLSSGNVLLTRNASGKTTPVPVKQGGEATAIPLVVLINGGTASASEIVAGALQDAGRAKLIGETTFGTGTVLSQFPLPDGSALLLATEEWLTPAGRTIWHKGIAPDEKVSLSRQASALPPDELGKMSMKQIDASGDAQLLSGIRQLKTDLSQRR